MERPKAGDTASKHDDSGIGPAGQSIRRRHMPYSAELWDRIRPIWQELSSHTQNASVFLSPEFIDSWFPHFAPTLRPSALIWEEPGGLPVACVLLSRKRVHIGPFPLTRVYVNATGDHIVDTEHNDILVLPEYRDRVLRDFVTHVLESKPDELALTGFDAQIAERLGELWPARVYDGYFGDAPFVALGRLRSESTPYLSALSGNTRKQIRQTLRRYESRFGAASLERASTTAEAQSWLQELIALHEKRWNARGLPGAFSTRLSRDFHDALVRSHVEGADGDSRTRLDLLRLQFGGTTTGFIYNFVYRRRVSFYQGGFDYLPGDNRLRPGLVMHALAIERYLGEGQLEYDFLGGEAGVVQYKRSLSTDIRRLAWTRLPVPGLKMSLLGRIRRLRRALRPARKPARRKP